MTRKYGVYEEFDWEEICGGFSDYRTVEEVDETESGLFITLE